MWNFGIPYKLKQWFDLIVQPGITFRFDPAQGYLPLLKDRPTIVILASGSDFVTGMNRGRIDMASPYLREILRFIGITDVRFALIGPTAGPAEPTRVGARGRAPAPGGLGGELLTRPDLTTGRFLRPPRRDLPSNSVAQLGRTH